MALAYSLHQWLTKILHTADFTLQPLVGDASFRHYYRIHAQQTYVLMVAPPRQERTEVFVKLARNWRAYGLRVPTIFGWEPKQGWVLLSDFGDEVLHTHLNAENVESFYQQAMHLLLSLQDVPGESLAVFDEAYIRLELNYFKEWFLEKWLGIESDEQLLEQLTQQIVACVVEQPQVVIHRDYHSRNLMVLADQELGILDFQDAMYGPISYDLVSLLKDCYIDWPRAKVEQWVNDFCQLLKARKRFTFEGAAFLQWFDWMGLQRHLKVLGIFCRLQLRDQKLQYLAYLPRITDYILQIGAIYPQLASWQAWFLQIVPHLNRKLANR